MGSKGNDVTALQQILKEKGLYAFPTATGYFGPVTQQAVKLFQKTEGIVSIGTPETTGYGVVGPKTIASLNAFEGTSSLSTTSISASTTTSFTRNLEYGMQGQDVLALQEFLNANGFTIANSGPGSPGHETDYFGSATQSALIKFQQANHITPAVGYFGPITRASFTSVSQSQNQGQANTAFVCPSSLLCTPTFVSSIFSSSPCSASQVPISTNGVISCMAIRGGGSSYTTPATQMTDTTPPVISSIASTTSQTGATITWTTDKNSSSQVEYGLTSSYTASTTLDSTLTTSHSVNISGLMANTTYHFAPYSTDSSGTSYGNDQTFTTSQQIVTLNIPFYATSTITLLGTQTAIASSSMTVSCADMSGNTLSCSKSYAPDTYNSAYSNLTLTFSGQQSGIVTVSGPQTFDHYVDSINGNDSNNGASPSKAFKTIGKVTGLGMTSGETIGLANNSWWREGISLNNTSHILVGSYGTGTMPLLDESNIITGTDAYGNSSTTAWTNTTGTTWQATVYTNSGGWVNFWKNNTYVPQASSLANCESSVSSYWVSSENGGTITLYYNSGSVSNPGSDGNLYEYSARVAGIAGFGDGAMYDTVIGIRVRRSLNNNGGIDLGNYAMVLNSEADDGTKHNILVGDGSVVNNLTLHNAWYNGQGSSLFVFFADNTQGAGVTVNGLTATMDVYDQTVEGIYGHYTGGSGFGPNVAFTNVTCTNTSACVILLPIPAVVLLRGLMPLLPI
jgi:peptidoglycan hydrolase-like protein with peptidoglycan-binding domain